LRPLPAVALSANDYGSPLRPDLKLPKGDTVNLEAGALYTDTLRYRDSLYSECSCTYRHISVSMRDADLPDSLASVTFYYGSERSVHPMIVDTFPEGTLTTVYDTIGILAP
jgi:hypothetical protein